MKTIANTRRRFLKQLGLGATSLAASRTTFADPEPPNRLPNILFALADDWSWPHASIAHALGMPGSDSVVKTPVPSHCPAARRGLKDR